MKKILIVDDEKNIRMTLKYCLSELDYTIESASDGLEALGKMHQENFDLVLLDIQMPNLSGLELLKKMREENIKSLVVMMTAYGTIEKAVDAMKLGAIDFISKPFTPETIRNIISNIFSREFLKEEVVETFDEILEFAKKSITLNELDKAETYLKKALSVETQSPEVLNILGVLSEYHGKIQEAQKYYRAALSFEPSYMPATKNLERTAQFVYTQAGIIMGNEKNDFK